MTNITPIPYQLDSSKYFSKLVNLPYACWLDSGKPHSQHGRFDILTALPTKRLVTTGRCTQLTHFDRSGKILKVEKFSIDPLSLLQEQLSLLSQVREENIPFTGGAIGFFSYEFGKQLQGLNSATNKHFADIEMGIYHWALVQDHLTQKAYLTSLPECPPQIIDLIKKKLESDSALLEPFFVDRIQALISPEEYQQALGRINDYILAGDCYQVNFTHGFQAHYQGHPYSAYQSLRQLMASPFSAYLQLGEQAILSLSPERFLKVNERQAFTQPIKGTMARNTDPGKDQQQARLLLESEKNQAENLMIVDLLRNDLGHQCVPGSIQVDNLFALESFPNVHHLVSSISGTLNEKAHSLDLLRDCFPGGSITGAPKRRAMEIIDELEVGRREVYCGSIGYIAANGDMDTNIAIRTVSCDGQELNCWGGGGIVADSKPHEEYQESLDKVKAILACLESGR